VKADPQTDGQAEIFGTSFSIQNSIVRIHLIRGTFARIGSEQLFSAA
jgi:hypothetical protein